MPSNRRKDVLPQAARTLDEASALLAELREHEGALKRLAASRDRLIGRLKAEHDAGAAPIKLAVKGLMDRLKPWWLVAGGELAGGRKSMELAGCVIGTRVGNPKLVVPKERDEASLARDLLDAGLRHLARVSVALDKPAIIAVVRAAPTTADDVEAQATVLGLGFAVEQPETFFVETKQAGAGPELVTDADRRVA